MQNNRRQFLKLSGLTGLTVAGSALFSGFSAAPVAQHQSTPMETDAISTADDDNLSIIGLYGQLAETLTANKLPSLSFRRPEWKNIDEWRVVARQRATERMAIPDIGGLPEVKVVRQYEYDGLHIEELTWQLPYGRPTEAILLKPINAKGPLPGILAFHDHGGNKYFGKHKITKISDKQHPLMKAHQEHYYDNMAWANEIAKKGYVVLVSDAFTFGSRRVMLQDVPTRLRNGLNDNDPDKPAQVEAYNNWAGNHEHVMAKSLFCAGTTWPAVFFAEDQKALDVLCARKDVDPERIGCGGLSGGGVRTVFMGGLDPRIKCVVCIGFMTTWNDFLHHKSFTHTWMTYVPLLPKELDFPEILGLRTPLPTLVQNDSEDQLYTLPEMKKADKILGEIFKKAGAEDRYKCSYYPGPHKFDAKMQKEAFSWFDKWLKA